MNSSTGTSDSIDTLSPAMQERLAVLLDEYVADLDRGISHDPDELAAAHPELEAPLRKYIESLGFVHRASRELPLDAQTGSEIASPRSEVLQSRSKDVQSHSEFSSFLQPESADWESTGKRSTGKPSQPDWTDRRQRRRRKRLGDYLLEREIGRGGMGVVYEARQLSLGRRVALKVLPFAAVLDQKQIARFQNEAQAAAQLHHPHIVPVYAVGCERGVHYYSMQYIEGQSMDQAIHELQQFASKRPPSREHEEPYPKPITPGVALTQSIPSGTPEARPSDEAAREGREAGTDDRRSEQARRSTVIESVGFSTACSVTSRGHHRRVAELGIQAADALAHAHDVGVIHRDVKPSNLLIDQQGQLWVTDFGLARCQAGGSFTRTGEVLGTLRYMSPEQGEGRSYLVDHRTDIYALGVTLYELLTLRPAFDADNHHELLTQKQRHQPPAPRHLNPSAPVDLETVLLKAMSKSREDRYATAREFAEDLRRFLKGEPTIARRPTVLDRATRWVAKNARAVTVGVGVALLMAGLACSTLFAVAHYREAERERLASENLRQELVTLRGELGARDVVGLPATTEFNGEPHARLQAERRRYREVATRLERDSDQRDQLGLLYATIAEISAQLGEVDEALDDYKKAREAFAEQHRESPHLPAPVAASAVCAANTGQLLADHGRTEAAAKSFRAAIDRQRKLVAENPDVQEFRRELALSYMNLGLLNFRMGDGRQSRLLCERAVEQLRKLPVSSIDSDDQEDLLTAAALASARGNLAVILAADDNDEAERLYRAAISVHQRLAERFSHRVQHLREAATCWNNLGTLQTQTGRYEEAIESFEHALDWQRDCARLTPYAAQRRRELARTLNNLAQARLRNQQTSQARLALLEAGKILERLRKDSPAHPDTLSLLAAMRHNQAVVAEQQGDVETARQGFAQACRDQGFANELAPNVVEYEQLLDEHRRQLTRVRNAVEALGESGHDQTHDDEARL